MGKCVCCGTLLFLKLSQPLWHLLLCGGKTRKVTKAKESGGNTIRSNLNSTN